MISTAPHPAERVNQVSEVSRGKQGLPRILLRDLLTSIGRGGGCRPVWGAGVKRLVIEDGADAALPTRHQENMSLSALTRYGPRFSKEILRKEVIQPQVPLRLPCYDLVPIRGFAFGAVRRLRALPPFVA